MMSEHFVIGHKYPDVKISTSYSFGPSWTTRSSCWALFKETDHPGTFLDLVMDLNRNSEARPYTERDTPIFTCLAKLGRFHFPASPTGAGVSG